MSVLYESVKKFARNNNHGIILCNEKTILKNKTYQEIINLTDLIYKELSKYLAKASEYVGILMNHNIYLPSLIMSLQQLGKTFMFITPAKLTEASCGLQIKWIISLEEILIPNFEERAQFSVDNDIFILWKLTSLSPGKVSDNVFCVMQSSGSTGNNKIIEIPYERIKINSEYLSKIFEITESDLIFWGTPLTFDPTLIELLLGLLNGACLVIVPYKVYVNPYLLFKSIFTVSGISFLQMVPSVFLRWDEYHQKCVLHDKNLKTLALGGENFPTTILQYPRNDLLALYNLYGTTEVSCWATVYKIRAERSDDVIPLGTPLNDTVVEIRDEEGNIVKKGLGEIFIGSLTRNCIINNDQTDYHNKTVFHETGDIAEITKDRIIYQYRKNRVIKRFGQRINLTKIEESISQETGLPSRCIWMKDIQKLLIYVVVENIITGHRDKILDKIQVKLLNVIPEASFPDHIDLINKFPLTCHGKIDEKTLANMYSLTMAKNKFSVKNADVLINICSKYLGLSSEVLNANGDHSFLELGGTSIGILQLNNELKDLLENDYPDEFLKALFEKSLKECSLIIKNYKHEKRKNNEVQVYESKKKRIDDEFKVLWKCNLKACIDSSPLLFQKNKTTYIAVGSFSHLFVVVDAVGNVVFQLNLPDNIQSTAVFSDAIDKIFIGCFDGCMYCLDYVKKQESWKFSTGNTIVSSPRFVCDNSCIVFGSYDENIYCLKIIDGTKLWNQKLQGSIAGSPLKDPNKAKIFVATTRGYCYCIEEATGSITWEYNSEEPIFGNPAQFRNVGIVFPTVHSHLLCLSRTNGHLLWKFQTGGPVFSSIVCYKQNLIFGCHDKNLYIVEPSDKLCHLVGKVELDSEISSSVFVYVEDGNAFIVCACNAGILYIINFITLSIVKRIKFPGQIFSSPVVFERNVYVGCRDNFLYCIDISEYLK